MTKFKLAFKIFRLVLKLEIDHSILDRLTNASSLKVIVEEVDHAQEDWVS